MRASLLLLVTLVGMGLAGCAVQLITPTRDAVAPAARQANRELVIFAASSLTDALDALTAAFVEQTPGVTVITNYAGSSSLAAQLLEGAPADLFAPANPDQMEAVAAAGLLASPPQLFTGNRLTVIVPADNPAAVSSFRDLARPEVGLVLAIPGVPVRAYTDELLAALREDPAFGPTFADAFYANVVSEEANVRQVAAKVALGEADAGLVYASDVTSQLSEAVTELALPAEYSITAAYPLAPLTAAREPEVAAAFIEFVLSEAGQSILQQWGFEQRPE